MGLRPRYEQAPYREVQIMMLFQKTTAKLFWWTQGVHSKRSVFDRARQKYSRLYQPEAISKSLYDTMLTRHLRLIPESSNAP